MNIISVVNFHGYFICESSSLGLFNSTCDDFTYSFPAGAYILTGEIDSGAWAFASTLCPRKGKNRSTMFPDTKFYFKGKEVSLAEIRMHVCDIDNKKKGAINNKSIRYRIEKGLHHSDINYTPEELSEMFWIHKDRFEKPIYAVGNEFICCNAAIGFANGKQIYCFPWISKLRMETYYTRIKHICEVLTKMGCVVIVPISNQITSMLPFNTIPFPRNRPIDYYRTIDPLPPTDT